VRKLEQGLARAEWARAHPQPNAHQPPAPPFPLSFSFTSGMVLDAMRRLAPDLDPDLALDSLTPNLVGRLLRQLRLQPHRTASLRVWATTTLHLARLARAYALPVPSDLDHHFTAALSLLSIEHSPEAHGGT